MMNSTKSSPKNIALACLLTHCFSQSGFAITNIESQRDPLEEDGISGKFQLAFSGKSGNADKQNWFFRHNTKYRVDNSEWLFIATYEKGEANDVTNTDNDFYHLRFTHYLEPSFGLEAFIQQQSDAFRLQDSRALLGGGVRKAYEFLDGTLRTHFGVGAFFTREVFDTTPLPFEEDYWRGNVYNVIKYKPNKQTSLSHTLYWQPRLKRFSDSYATSDFELAVNVIGALNLTFNVQINYDSEPVQEVEEVDISYRSGLSYTF